MDSEWFAPFPLLPTATDTALPLDKNSLSNWKIQAWEQRVMLPVFGK